MSRTSQPEITIDDVPHSAPQVLFNDKEEKIPHHTEEADTANQHEPPAIPDNNETSRLVNNNETGICQQRGKIKANKDIAKILSRNGIQISMPRNHTCQTRPAQNKHCSTVETHLTHPIRIRQQKRWIIDVLP